MITNIEKAEILVQALPYIKRYHGKTIVIKYGGSAMMDEEIKIEFIKDIVLMKYIGINPVIVHGGGPGINAMLTKIGKESKFVLGNRVTDEETMDVVEMVLSGKVNKGIVSEINKSGGKAIGVSGKDGNMIKVEKKYILQDDEKIDIGFVGEIKELNIGIIDMMNQNDYIPVISTIGVDDDGRTYNINADYVAGEIASKINADRLIFMTDVDGIMEDHSKKDTLISEIKYSEVIKKIESEIITGGMIPKVETCLHALNKGVDNVVILNGRTKHSILLELFTEDGIGTLIKMD